MYVCTQTRPTVDIRFDNVLRQIRADSLIHRRVRQPFLALRIVYCAISATIVYRDAALHRAKMFSPVGKATRRP